MPLELTARRRDRTPLGELDAVQQALAEVFSGVEFYLRPSGPDLIREMYGAAASPEQLKKFAHIPAAYCGAFGGEGFAVEFSLGPVEIVESVALAVWGDTEAARPLLERLTASTGWGLDQP